MRSGEEINSADLRVYLNEALDERFSTISVKQFPAGASNLTYSVELDNREFVLRRPPFGNRVKSAHNMFREFSFLSKLSPVYSYAPKPIIFCKNKAIIGSEFYLMEKKSGVIIRGDLTNCFPSEANYQIENSMDFRTRICESFIGNLAKLHSLDINKSGLSEFGNPAGYTKRQVDGWNERYFHAKTDEHIELEAVATWLSENLPNEESISIVHNDYKFDNVMFDPLDPTRITAVLDWEMATIGSPLLDFGTTLAYWISADQGIDLLAMPFNPRILMTNVSRNELASIYSSLRPQTPSNLVYYYAFGLFKVATIAQQIYYRYLNGFTKDKRFANFNHFVAKFGMLAIDSIEKDSI